MVTFLAKPSVPCSDCIQQKRSQDFDFKSKARRYIQISETKARYPDFETKILDEQDWWSTDSWLSQDLTPVLVVEKAPVSN